MNKRNKKVDVGSSNFLVTNGGTTKARRFRQRRIREIISEDHGASKRIRETCETCYESLDQNADGNGLTHDTFMPRNGIESPKLFKGVITSGVEDNIYNDYEEIPTEEFASVSTTKALPVVKKEKVTKKYEDDFMKIKDEMSEKASEMLKDCVSNKENTDETIPLGCQLLSFSYEKETTLYEGVTQESERYSREYKETPFPVSGIDFSIFGNPQQFAEAVNLKGKTVKECIVAYAKYRVKDKKGLARYHMLLIYILIVEKLAGDMLMPEVIGRSFLSMFTKYLAPRLSPSTIDGLVCNLRCIIRWASRHGAIICDDIDDWKFNNKNSKPKVYLTFEEISRVYYFNVNDLPVRPQHKRTLARVKDEFVLSCFLGQRYSDMVRIKKADFKGSSSEVFTIKQKKTDNIAVLEFNRIYGGIPKYARDILKKYDYNSPYTGYLSNYNRYLHELMRYIGFDDEVTYEYKFNDSIVTKKFPRYELITSHTGRRSFITNSINRNVNPQYIKRASGHTSDSSFNKYDIYNTYQ